MKKTVSKGSARPLTKKAAVKSAKKVLRTVRKLDKPILIKQDIEFGTDNRWINATEITPNPAWVPPSGVARYVWGSNDINGPAAVVARRFTINRNPSAIDDASLFLSVDNFAIVLINGRAVVIDPPQATVAFFNPGRNFDILRFLRRGRNDIVIAAFNFPSNANRTPGNPAGVLARVEIEFKE